MKIAADGNQMKVVFDLIFKHYIHAILMIDDLQNLVGWSRLSENDKKYYL